MPPLKLPFAIFQAALRNDVPRLLRSARRLNRLSRTLAVVFIALGIVAEALLI